MDILSVRALLHTRSIYDIPLRVTYYARVSSESDDQLNSLGNQIAYYEDLIKRNQNWTFVPGYIDEGLSGISTKKRENFNIDNFVNTWIIKEQKYFNECQLVKYSDIVINTDDYF